MSTQTRTFPATLNNLSTAVVAEIIHFRDAPLLIDEVAAVYLEAMFLNISLKSFQLMTFPNYEGDESDAERLSLYSAAEIKSQKIGLRILSRKNDTGTWREKAEVILTNAGRKSYFDLLIPYLAKAQVRLLEYNDAIGVQLIDYGNGLLKVNDYIEIDCAVSVEIAKKKGNDVEALSARIASLELAVNGKLIDLPANTLLGRGATKGTVENIDRATFKAADSDLLDGIDSTRVVFGDDFSKSIGGGGTVTANNIFTTSGFIDIYGSQSIFPTGIEHINGFQTRHRNLSNSWGMQAGCQHNIPNEFYFRTITAGTFNPWNRIWNSGNLPLQFPAISAYGSIGIPGTNGGYAGIHFSGAADGAVLMLGGGSRQSGVWSPNASGGWHWMYNNGNFNIFSSDVATEGTYLGLFKGLNSLPGYPNNRYPTVRTDDINLYFSVGGTYSAYMTTNGVLSAISDKNKKENLKITDDNKILELLLNIPIYTYNFKKSDTRIRNLSCMAQDFYAAFGLGGDVEIDEDESPICPSKMLAPSDAIGVCMAAIKGLAAEVKILKKK